MRRLTHGAWVLLADGEKALFLENTSRSRDPSLKVSEMRGQFNPPVKVRGTERPGRAPGTVGTGRVALQATDWHRLDKEKFAGELADVLLKHVRADDFKELVIVAPPVLLGDLRHAMSDHVRERVVAEIPKTLTHHPIEEIEGMLKEAIEEMS